MASTLELLSLADARARAADTPLVAGVVDTCVEAAKAALVCSDACAPLADVFHLEECVSRTRTTAEVGWMTANAALRRGVDRTVLRPLVEACRAACQASASACSPHAPHHEFCCVCAVACRGCVEACSALLTHWDAEEAAALGASNVDASEGSDPA